jgi:hypothetical protein
MSELSVQWDAYLHELTKAGATVVEHLQPGFTGAEIDELAPSELTFPPELREWFTLHRLGPDHTHWTVAGFWESPGLKHLIPQYDGWNVLREDPLSAWRSTLFPFARRDSAGLFVECDPEQPPHIFYFDPWTSDAPASTATSIADVVARWRELLRLGAIIVDERGELGRGVDLDDPLV